MPPTLEKTLLKTTLLAAALAAPALVHAQAQVSNTLYGQFRLSASHVDTHTIDGATRVEDNASRIGLRGNVALDGVTAFYHFEAGATNDTGGTALTSRFYFAGLRGGFGAIAFGRHSPAYKMAGVQLDPNFDTAGAGVSGDFTAAAGSYGLSRLANGFANNAIAYTSPALGKVTLNAGAYLDDSDAGKHSYNAGIGYTDKALNLGFQYFDAGSVAAEWNPFTNIVDRRFYRAHGSYKFGAFSLGASLEREQSKTDAFADIDYLFLAGSYQASDALRLTASVGTVSEGAAEGTGLRFGAYRTVLPGAQVYAVASHVSRDAPGVGDTNVLSLGFIYNFSAEL